MLVRALISRSVISPGFHRRAHRRRQVLSGRCVPFRGN